MKVLELAHGLSLPADEAVTQKSDKMGGVGACYQHAATPNHRPEIGGLAAMADPHFNIEALKRRIISGSVIDEAGCWIWQASTKNGYGQISVDGRSTYTHTLSYRIFIGPIHDGLRVCHRCDEPRCNNPQHFFLGTQAQNLSDMRQKGRGSRPPIRRGEAHHATPLSDAQVVQIRALSASGTKQRDIAAQFGCCQATVSSIVRLEYRKEAK